MAASPARVASSIASACWSITTILERSTPRASSVSTAARPFVPNPMTMVWSFKPLLHMRSRKAVRVRSASTSMVVPTRMIRNRIRAGVISRVVASRASVGHRRDVAVAGGGDADGRVVERVEEADGRPVEVAVAVAAEVGDDRDEDQQADGDAQPGGQAPPRARDAGGEADDGLGERHGRERSRREPSGGARTVAPAFHEQSGRTASGRRADAGSRRASRRAEGAGHLPPPAHGERSAGSPRGARRAPGAAALLGERARAGRPPAGPRGGGRRGDALGRRRRRGARGIGHDDAAPAARGAPGDVHRHALRACCSAPARWPTSA